MTSGQVSTRLIAKLDMASPMAAAYAARVWTSPRVRDLYPRYLRMMHAIVRATLPLIDTALAEAQRRAAEDATAAALTGFLERHRLGEVGHDLWILDDLATLGEDPRSALDQLPPPAVAALVGAQYYWIHHYHPVCLLGHIAALEIHHPPPGFAERLMSVTGFPRQAFQALLGHEELDGDHQRALCEVLDRLPLTGSQETAIGVSALGTVRLSLDVLDEMVDAGKPDRGAPESSFRSDLHAIGALRAR